MGVSAIGAAKALQLAVAVGLLVLVWLIYPGLSPSVVVACYVAASLVAMGDRRVGIWLAFAFSILAFVFSAWGSYRYIDNGFDYLTGNFAGRAGIHWPAYLFLFVALGSITAVVLQVLSWRWMIWPRERRVS